MALGPEVNKKEKENTSILISLPMPFVPWSTTSFLKLWAKINLLFLNLSFLDALLQKKKNEQYSSLTINIETVPIQSVGAQLSDTIG